MHGTPSSLFISAGLLGASAVLFGAFGAHGLENSPIDADLLEAYRTGASYHLWHSLALFGLAAAWDKLRPGRARAAAWCFGLGILLFSGSLYGMGFASAAGGEASFLGPITPIGGLALTAGWIMVALAAVGARSAPA
jgi:uncharacterized membrane protein YgdD (TMEM256/DUF423 family)